MVLSASLLLSIDVVLWQVQQECVGAKELKLDGAHAGRALQDCFVMLAPLVVIGVVLMKAERRI